MFAHVKTSIVHNLSILLCNAHLRTGHFSHLQGLNASINFCLAAQLYLTNRFHRQEILTYTAERLYNVYLSHSHGLNFITFRSFWIYSLQFFIPIFSPKQRQRRSVCGQHQER